ncbi:hypothetical protein ElyMa_000984500 [Elysia marginata]|uniref:Uncharacterized protein n=1 Tax=Elysia marginata TaxID=1093978 RepID=A0AAV4HK89_9GAST|nr:hypothetical protein ElyMa_000984500 [Elysia marginata]
MEEKNFEYAIDSSEKSHLPVKNLDCNFGSRTLPDQTDATNRKVNRPDSLSVACVTASEHYSSDTDDADTVVGEHVPNIEVIALDLEADIGAEGGCKLFERYCTLADSSTGKTSPARKSATELELRDIPGDHYISRANNSGICENQNIPWSRKSPDHSDVYGTHRAIHFARSERGSPRTLYIGEYCLASPITDRFEVSKNNHLRQGINALLEKENTNQPYYDKRKGLGRNTPVVYANIPNSVNYNPTILCPTSSFQSESLNSAHHKSVQSKFTEEFFQSTYGAKNGDCSQPPSVVQQTQAECSSCSCLRSVSNKEKINLGNGCTTFKPEFSGLKGNQATADMESVPQSKSNAQSSGRHYYNSGSALIKPLMKRMSMLAKTGAFRSWVSTGEKSSKSGKGKKECKTSDKDCFRNPAPEDDDGNSTVAGLDLSLPPRFSQIDSCPRHPLPSLPPQHPQYSQSYQHHNKHSLGYPQQQQRQNQYHHSQSGSTNAERELFINLHHPQQERYVLHQSCSGFSLGHSLHSPNPSQLQPTYPHFYHYQQQQQQHQQAQLLPQPQQHRQIVRHPSTDSLSSLLQTVRCGRSRYRISPVSLLWTFLSVLLAGACALSLATPCWMVHPDHIHSFGLFNLCVRDRRFALPRPLCMPYSEMTRLSITPPSRFTPSSFQPHSSYSYSNPSAYQDIPDSSMKSEHLRRKRSGGFNKRDFNSPSGYPNFAAKNNQTFANNRLGAKTRKPSESFSYDNEILPFHRHNHVLNDKRKASKNDMSSKAFTNDGSKPVSKKAQTASQRNINSRQRSYDNPVDSNASGLYSIPSVAWQAACLLFGAGVCVQILGAVISIVILIVSDPLHRRLATANGFLQTAGAPPTHTLFPSLARSPHLGLSHLATTMITPKRQGSDRTPLQV